MADRARQLHAFYLTSGSGNPHQWARLVRDYLSRSSLRDATLTYTKNLPQRTQQSLLLTACASRTNPNLGRSLHAEAIKAASIHDLIVGTSVVSMYSKCGLLGDARKAFDEMPERNAVTYNAIIAGYAMGGDMERALELFVSMTSRTFVTWATVIRGFAEKGDTAEARRWFGATPPGMRTVVTWTVLVHGYTVRGEMEAARELFERMPARNAFVWSSMITGYFKAGDAKEAQVVFDRIPMRNLVNWNALIAGYAQLGCSEKALRAFRRMLEDRVEPDEFTMASVLSACAQLGSLQHGREMHEFVNRKRIRKNHFVLNGLVDMYLKCGDLGSARRIFNGMHSRNTECWNSMISGLASHGRCEEVLQLFSRMEGSEAKPDVITLLAVLGACAHGGFVDDGLDIFNKFGRFGVTAGVRHYGCLVDLLGRAGRVEEAYGVIKSMPMEPNEVIWGALLGACKVHGDAQTSRRVRDEIGSLCLRGEYANDGSLCSRGEYANDAEYVMLSSILAASEKWEQAEMTRRKMSENGIEKTPGCSSIELDSAEHQPYAGICT